MLNQGLLKELEIIKQNSEDFYQFKRRNSTFMNGNEIILL